MDSVYSLYTEGDLFNQIFSVLLISLNKLFGINNGNTLILSYYKLVLGFALIISLCFSIYNYMKNNNGGDFPIISFFDIFHKGFNAPVIKILIFYVAVGVAFYPTEVQMIKPVKTNLNKTFSYKVHYPKNIVFSTNIDNHRYFLAPLILSFPMGIVNSIFYGIPLLTPKTELSNDLNKIYDIDDKYTIFNFINKIPLINGKLGNYDVLADSEVYEDYMTILKGQKKQIEEIEKFGSYLYKIPLFYGFSYGQDIVTMERYYNDPLNPYSESNPQDKVISLIKNLSYIKVLDTTFSFLGLINDRLNLISETLDNGFSEKDIVKNYDYVNGGIAKTKYLVDWDNLIERKFDTVVSDFASTVNSGKSIENTKYFNDLSNMNNNNSSFNNNNYVFFNNYYYKMNKGDISGDKQTQLESFYNNYLSTKKLMMMKEVLNYNNDEKNIKNNFLLNSLIQFTFPAYSTPLTSIQEQELSRCIGTQNSFYNEITGGCGDYTDYLIPNKAIIYKAKKDGYLSSQLPEIDFIKPNELTVKVDTDKLQKELEINLIDELKPLSIPYKTYISSIFNSSLNNNKFFTDFLSNYTDMLLFDYTFINKYGKDFNVLFDNSNKENLNFKQLNDLNTNIIGDCDGDCDGKIFDYFKIIDNNDVGIDKIFKLDIYNVIDREKEKLKLLKENLIYVIRKVENKLKNKNINNAFEFKELPRLLGKYKLHLKLTNQYLSFLENDGLNIDSMEKIHNYSKIMSLASQSVKMDIGEFYYNGLSGVSLLTPQYLDGYMDTLKVEAGLIDSILIYPTLIKNMGFSLNVNNLAVSDVLKKVLLTFNLYKDKNNFIKILGFYNKDTDDFQFSKDIETISESDFLQYSESDLLNISLENYNNNIKHLKDTDSYLYTFYKKHIAKTDVIQNINDYSLMFVNNIRYLFRLTYDFEFQKKASIIKNQKQFINNDNYIDVVNGFHNSMTSFQRKELTNYQSLYFSQFINTNKDMLYIQNVGYNNVNKILTEMLKKSNKSYDFNIYNLPYTTLNDDYYKSINFFNDYYNISENEDKIVFQSNFQNKSLLNYNMWLQGGYYFTVGLTFLVGAGETKGIVSSVTKSEKIIQIGGKVVEYGKKGLTIAKDATKMAITKIKPSGFGSFSGLTFFGTGTLISLKYVVSKILDLFIGSAYYISAFFIISVMSILYFFYTLWRTFLIPLLYVKYTLLTTIIKNMYEYFKEIVFGNYDYKFTSNVSTNVKDDILKLLTLTIGFIGYMALTYIILSFYISKALFISNYCLITMNSDLSGIILLLFVFLAFVTLIILQKFIYSIFSGEKLKFSFKS